ncbi:hypothetical protein [Domibacillus robiginosus]|uniref:hypothetical protein n=1 Tax=Domibacillus robiginosus TaxID=1071054 RepID=UPI000ABB0E33|nr:hypothetical protein [Domibacillus robiginosus]
MQKTKSFLEESLDADWSELMQTAKDLDYSEELNKLIIHVQLHNRKTPCFT